MTPVELNVAPAQVVIDPDRGGRLAGLTVAGLSLLVGREETTGDPLLWGAYPMAPWVGRVRRGRFTFAGQAYQLERDLAPHAIHGTVYRRPWQVDDLDDGGGFGGLGDASCQLSCQLGPGWPFGGVARQRIELSDNALRLTLEVHAADGPMPATCGWHPWWRRDLARGGALELDADLVGRWECGADALPTGAVVPVGDRPPQGWDDCFDVGRRPTVLRWPGALEVSVASDCPQLVVYDRPAHAICVEPQTGPPDALNLGCAVVEPSRPLVAHTTWSWVLS